MPNREGMVDGSYEDMMGGKGGLEGKGKMGGRDDWLLKRGIWEKQVTPKNRKISLATTKKSLIIFLLPPAEA